MCILLCFQAMASVTVETVTVTPVGMETNVNSSVTSAHGRASGDARLQMARSAATEVCFQREREWEGGWGVEWGVSQDLYLIFPR